jgi:hypothetical protein
MKSPRAEDDPGPKYLLYQTALHQSEHIRTAVSPHEKIILVRIISTFEKVEE